MKKVFLNEILRLGGDPADAIWTWLVQTGPHGSSFTWAQARSEPAGYVGIVHLEKIVAEMDMSIPEFKARARQIVRMGLKSEVTEIVLRAIQAAAVVGGKEELEQVRTLIQSDDTTIAAHAKACVFYLKHK